MNYLNENELQRLRKANLQKAITEKFNDNIEEFAIAVAKHRNFIYALLWDVANPNNRKISDKMARFLEKHAGLGNGYLDRSDPNSLDNEYITYVNYLDVIKSNNSENLVLSEEPDFPILRSELNKAEISSASDLLAIRVFDSSLTPVLNFNDTIIIDRSVIGLRNAQYYLITYHRQVQIRRLHQEAGKFKFVLNLNVDGYEQELDPESKNLTIEGIMVFSFKHTNSFIR